eukprot:scaffold15998_cov111-Isochrysis_galbana.AAC.7
MAPASACRIAAAYSAEQAGFSSRQALADGRERARDEVWAGGGWVRKPVTWAASRSRVIPSPAPASPWLTHRRTWSRATSLRVVALHTQ